MERPELRDLVSDWNSVLETKTRPGFGLLMVITDQAVDIGADSLLTQVVHDSSDVVAASSSCPHNCRKGTVTVPSRNLVSETVQQLVGPRDARARGGLTLGDLLWKAPAWRGQHPRRF